MIFGRHSTKTKVKIELYINYGNDDIVHKTLKADPGISALDALKLVVEIEYLPDESATSHQGAMVTGIDGFNVDLYHFWIYYVFEHDQMGWALPMCTPDSFCINDDCRLAWRYHIKSDGQDMLRYGPLQTSHCINKIRRCCRQF